MWGDMDLGRAARRSGLGIGMVVLAIVPMGHALAQPIVPIQYQVLAPAASGRAEAQRPVPRERIDNRNRLVLTGEWRDFSLLRAVVPEHWFPLASRLPDIAAPDEAENEDAPRQDPVNREIAEAAVPTLSQDEGETVAAPSDEERAACAARLAAVMAEQSITFASGGSAMAAESGPVLSAVAEILQACPAERLYVEGHTDSTGDPTVNLALSVSRAEAVVDGLMELGISPTRLFAIGYGASLPIADNETAAGRQANRRIVLSFEDTAISR